MIYKNLSIFSIILMTIILFNRFFFAIDEYKRISVERETDIYMQKICDTMDYKKIGRHSILCSQLNHRLSSPLIIHVSKSVVDDTLNREFTFQGILSIFLIFSTIMMISKIQYKLFHDPYNLPIIKKKSD